MRLKGEGEGRKNGGEGEAVLPLSHRTVQHEYPQHSGIDGQCGDARHYGLWAGITVPRERKASLSLLTNGFRVTHVVFFLPHAARCIFFFIFSFILLR